MNAITHIVLSELGNVHSVTGTSVTSKPNEALEVSEDKELKFSLWDLGAN